MIEKNVYSVLIGDADVSAIVGTRVFPVVVPPGTDFPAVVYFVASSNPVVTVQGKSETENRRIRVNVFGQDYSTVKDLAAKVESALMGATVFTVVPYGIVDAYEPDPVDNGFFRITQDFSIWE